MSKIWSTFLALSTAGAAAVVLGQGAESLTPETAHLGLGRVGTVCGTTGMVDCRSSDRTVVLYLNAPKGALRFRGQIPAAERHQFGRSLEDRYQFRPACVTGVIERYRGDHRIVVTRPDQLRVEEGDRPVAPPEGVYRACDEGVEPPRLLSDVKPSYTADAMRAKVQGSAVFEGIVRVDGTVGETRVVRSLDASFGLDQEAIRAFRQWRFEPGRFQGKIVPVMVTVEMVFTLR